MIRKVKAVIFDLDGTLGNTVPLCVEAFRRSIEPLIDRAISDEEIIATFGPSEEGTIMQLAPNNYEKGISDYLHYYELLHNMCPKPFDGIVDLLNSLKESQIRLAMVTGKGEHSTNITLKKFELTGFFERIETGHQLGPRKAEGIEAVADLFCNIDKREIVYVGDAPGDILSCRKAGVPVVSVTWANTVAPAELIQLMPDQLFHTVSDFSSWISSKI